MANLINDAISEISAGPQAGASESAGMVSDETSVSASESVVDSDDIEVQSAAGSEDTLEGASGTGTPAKQTEPKVSAAESKKLPEKEIITVSDDKGKRKVEVSYSDRASIRKAYELAHGARKWQAERDSALSKVTALEEKAKVLDALEQAFEQNGELGVLDLIAGKQGASQEFIAKQVAKAKFLEKATPEEKAQLEREERLQKLEREMARREKMDQEREAKLTAEREAREIETLQSSVNPIFEKYRFAGKLGEDEQAREDEDLFDDMLWNTALRRLKPYEEQGVEMTRELVDREFRAVAFQLRKRMNAQVEKKAAAVVEQKKQEATENAQASTMSAYKKGSVSQEASDLIGKGDFRSIFSNWGKFSGSFKK